MLELQHMHETQASAEHSKTAQFVFQLERMMENSGFNERRNGDAYLDLSRS